MKYKYRLENFVLFDCVGLERHLAEMAAKGLQLESIGRLVWKYRVTEPKKLTYSVTYAPDASLYDPQPTEEQQLLTDYCTAAGWQKVCDLAQLQIFVTEKVNPTPIETDESIRLEIIKKSMKKNMIFGHGLIALVFLMNVVLRIWNFAEYPLSNLPDGTFFNSIVMMSYGVLLMIADILYYLLWQSKAEKQVANGEPLPEAKHYRTFALVSWAILILLTLNMFLANSGAAMFLAMYLPGMFLILLAVYKTQQYLKKKGAAKAKNIIITLLVDCVLVFALISGLIHFSLSNHLFSNEAPAHYNVHGFNFPIWNDELPLRVSDLTDTDKDYPYYSFENRVKESVFLKAEDCSQNAPPDGENHPELRYGIYTVKMDFLYDYVLEELMEDEFRHYTEESKAMSAYIPQNAAEWNADTVYQLKIGSIEGETMEDQWILCKGDVIVLFRPYMELTEEMKPIVSQKLFG